MQYKRRRIRLTDPVGLYNEAVALIQKGDLNAARVRINELRKTGKGREGYEFLSGIIALQEGRYDQARSHLKRAIAIKGGGASCYYHLGLACAHGGRNDEAVAAYEMAVELEPDNAAANANLTNLYLERGLPEKAAEAARSALSSIPTKAEYHNNLANALLANNLCSEALAAVNNAIKLMPKNYAFHYNKGLILESLRRYEAAAAAYRDSTDLKPDYVQAYCNEGVALVAAGRPDLADYPYKKALEYDPSYHKVNSNYLFSLNYRTDLERRYIYDRHVAWGRAQHVRCWRGSGIVSEKRSDKIRVGYVSGDFRNHSVAFFFLPLIENHNKDAFEIYCYSNSKVEDSVTAAIKRQADKWRSVHELNDEQMYEIIRKDGIDILVDLSGHTSGNRLPVFAMRPAKKQVTWLGYPNTTGLKAVDFRITDEVTDPPGDSESFYSEKLLYIKNSFICYKPPPYDLEPGESPLVKNGYVRFGCFNVLAKINKEVISVWSSIIKQVPGAEIYIKNSSLDECSVRDRLYKMFADHGVEKARIELQGRVKRQEDHLGCYREIDIALDTFPYNGTTTTCEALWMGVPLISLSGDRHAARVGATILKSCGRNDWVSETHEGYIDLAVKLASSADRLIKARKNLREDFMESALMDAVSFAKRVEEKFCDILLR